MVLSAQMAKAGPPMEGKDLHSAISAGASCRPPRRSAIGSLTIAGLALAFAREGSRPRGSVVHRRGRLVARRMARGDQPVRRPPAAGGVLRSEQPDGAVDAGARAVGRPRVCGQGRRLRVAGHHDRRHRSRRDCRRVCVGGRACARRAGACAHRARVAAHVRPRASRRHALSRQGSAAGVGLSAVAGQGYADPALRLLGGARSDRGVRRSARSEGILAPAHSTTQARGRGDSRGAGSGGHRGAMAGAGGCGRWCAADEPPRVAASCSIEGPASVRRDRGLPELEAAAAFDRRGSTMLEGVMLGVRDALAADPRVFVFGEDVGGKYGNAFLLLRPLLEEFGDRILNRRWRRGRCSASAWVRRSPGSGRSAKCSSTISSRPVSIRSSTTRRRSGTDGAAVGADGAADAVGRPAACGPVPQPEHRGLVLPHAGAQDRRPVDARDARALMASAVADPDPVLYYEHIALYRDPRIKQVLDRRARRRRCRSARPRCAGRVTTSRSFRTARTCTSRCASPNGSRPPGSRRRVLDLRTLVPLDRGAVLAVARHCHRVLIIHEDSRTGGIGESLAAIIQEEAFESLDAPMRDHRRARHAGAVLSAARGVLPARARTRSTRRAPARWRTDRGQLSVFRFFRLKAEATRLRSAWSRRGFGRSVGRRAPSPEPRTPSPEPRTPNPEAPSPGAPSPEPRDPEPRAPSPEPRAPSPGECVAQRLLEVSFLTQTVYC